MNLEEILCQEDISNKRRRRHRDSTVTVAVGSSLGKNSNFCKINSRITCI